MDNEELEIKLALKTLQLSIETVTLKKIEFQYKKLAKIYHPDKNLRNNPTFSKLFSDLNNAYRLLRKKYSLVENIRQNALIVVDNNENEIMKSNSCKRCNSKSRYELLDYRGYKICKNCFQYLALRDQKKFLEKQNQLQINLNNRPIPPPVNVNVHQSNNQNQSNRGPNKFIKFLIIVVILLIILGAIITLVSHFSK